MVDYSYMSPPVFANNAPADSSMVDRILRVEGTGQASTSSSVGPGQFIRSTWLDMVRKYRPDLAQNRSDSQILALRTDPNFKALGSEMTGAYARENQGIISGAGFQPTAGNTYLAHFAGPGGAIKLLNANRDTPVSQILPQAVSANPFLAKMTAGDAIRWAEGKMTGVSAPSPSAQYGAGDSPAIGTPPIAPQGPAFAPQGQAVASAPAPGPSGLLGMITSALGITPKPQPAAGVTGIPAQAPQAASQLTQPYQPPTPPPLQLPDENLLSFAGQQPMRLTPPRLTAGRGFY